MPHKTKQSIKVVKEDITIKKVKVTNFANVKIFFLKYNLVGEETFTHWLNNNLNHILTILSRQVLARGLLTGGSLYLTKIDSIQKYSNKKKKTN